MRSWLRLNGVAGDDTEGEVNTAIRATEEYVEGACPECFTDDDPPVFVPTTRIYQGAKMYAAREIRRRNSPGGVESFGDAGVAFVTKYDGDIERFLRTGGSTVPGVG